jgi:hypothetical protein
MSAMREGFTRGNWRKEAQFYGPIVPFSDVYDKARAPKPARTRLDNILSREDVEDQVPKREDGRSFQNTEIGPGTFLRDVSAVQQPQERTG